MKNQYFGDEHDYLKYGLLYLLYTQYIIDKRLFIAWYLTEDDDDSSKKEGDTKTGDGNKREYLKNNNYREFDAAIYDKLKDYHEKRDIEEAENILISVCPGTKFYSKTLDNTTNRAKWFEKLKSNAKGFEFVFVDPDNGIKFSNDKSVKHITLNEILELWNEEHSIIVYQHFPHFDREVFQYGVVVKLAKLLKNSYLSAIKAGDVVYLFLLQQKDIGEFVAFVEKWKGKFSTLEKEKGYRKDIQQKIEVVFINNKEEIVSKQIEHLKPDIKLSQP